MNDIHEAAVVRSVEGEGDLRSPRVTEELIRQYFAEQPIKTVGPDTIDLLEAFEGLFETKLNDRLKELCPALEKYQIIVVDDEPHFRVETRQGLATLKCGDNSPDLSQNIIGEFADGKNTYEFLRRLDPEKRHLLILDSRIPCGVDTERESMDGCGAILRAITRMEWNHVSVILRSSEMYPTPIEAVTASHPFVLGRLGKVGCSCLFQYALAASPDVVEAIIADSKKTI